MKLGAGLIWLGGGLLFAQAATFSIINTNDSGAGSLRQAITDANSSGTASLIQFNLGGSGPFTITPATPLPNITVPVTIDGYTQAGATPNTLSNGWDGVIQIRLDRQSVAGVNDGLVFTASSNLVRGLAVLRFAQHGLIFRNGSGNVLEGCAIGIDPTNDAVRLNGVGITVTNAPATVIGGTAPAQRNIISGNSQAGIEISGSNCAGSVILGNFLGTGMQGASAVGNLTSIVLTNATGVSVGSLAAGARNVIFGGAAITVINGGANLMQQNWIGITVLGTNRMPGLIQNGIVLLNSVSNVIGGTAPGARNVIAGAATGINISGPGTIVKGNFIGTDATGRTNYGGSGVAVSLPTFNNVIGGGEPGAGNVIAGYFQSGIAMFNSGRSNVIQGNFIGTDLTGTLRLGNAQNGIQILGTWNNIIGGTNAGEGNVIAFNRSNGVYISFSAATNNLVRGNAIYGNTNSALDLDPLGPTANDNADADTGPNNLQNFPVLAGATNYGSSLAVAGALNSAPNASYWIDFYAQPACDGSGFGEGAQYLGFRKVTTDGSGNAPFVAALSGVASIGDIITATATDTNGNTSEFSACVQALGAVADLVVWQAISPPSLAVGQAAEFTIVVSNRGPVAAQGVAISDVLPGGAAFLSASATQGTCSNSPGGVVSCDLGAISPGDVAVVTIHAQITAGGENANAITVSSATFDPNSANNAVTNSVAAEALPALSIVPAQAPGEVILSWPAPSMTNRFVVEESTRVESPAGWMLLLQDPQWNAGRFELLVPTNAAAAFFRLRSRVDPLLSNAEWSAAVPLNGSGVLTLRYSDPDYSIASLDLVVENAAGISGGAWPAGLAGISGATNSARVGFSSSLLRIGTNLLTLRIRDVYGNVVGETTAVVDLVGTAAGGSAPVLAGLAPGAVAWNRPVGLFDQVKPRFTLSFSDADADLYVLRVRLQPPAGPAQFAELDARSLGLTGSAGTASVALLSFHHDSPPGTYQVTATLIDTNGHLSQPRTAAVQLVESGGTVPLAITGMTLDQGAAGNYTALLGTGFSTNLEGNSVTLNGTRVPVVDGDSTTLLVQIPGGVSGGHFKVENLNGRSFSPSPFLVPPDVSIAPTNPSVVVGGRLTFHATVVSSTNEQVLWSVRAPAGDTNTGSISADGLFTAPSDLPAGGVVFVRALLAVNTNILDETTVSILPPPAIPGGNAILARVGGEVRSFDGVSGVAIPPAALPGNATITVQTLRGPALPAAPAGFDLLGAAEFGPAGLSFAAPVTIRFPLARHFAPGTALPLRLFSAGSAVDEGIVATVGPDGSDATAQVLHFSAYGAIAPAAAGAGPVSISAAEPVAFQEGRTLPMRLSGSGLASNLMPAVVLAGAPTTDVLPAGYIGHDTEAGVLLHVNPIADLGEGQARLYTLQLKRGSAIVAQTDFTVTGLNELIVPAAGTVTLVDPPPRRYSTIQVDGVVRVVSGIFTAESTGPVIVRGSIDAHGEDGNPASGRNGGARVRFGGAGGMGRDDGGCSITSLITGCDYDGAPDETFGRNAVTCSGVSAGDDRQGSCDENQLRGRPYGLGGLPGVNFDAPKEVVAIAESIAACIGSGGAACADVGQAVYRFVSGLVQVADGEVTGGHGFGSDYTTAVAGSLAGGGGGGAGRISATIPAVPLPINVLQDILDFLGINVPVSLPDVLDVGIAVTGGGGGSGGEGGRGVRLIASGEVTVPGSITAAGGRGGDGSASGDVNVETSIVGIGIHLQAFSGAPAFAGGGGGGGAGGAVSVRSAFENPPAASISAAGGEGGNGGVTIVDLANSRVSFAYESSSDGRGARGFSTIEGPVYSSVTTGAWIRNNVTDRFLLQLRVHAFSDRPLHVIVEGAGGATRDVTTRTDSNGVHTAVVVLFPGFNTLYVVKRLNHELLNISLLALGTDSDGDGLSDADELDLGTNPNLADTDGDGVGDLAEVLAGTDPNNPDADLDGLPDGVEAALHTDSHNPDSDGDGIWDGAEQFLGANPLAANGVPPIPPGSVFTQARGAAGGNFLALVNPTNSTFGLLGKANSGNGFGFAFDTAGTLYIAQYTQLATCPDVFHADASGNLTTSLVGDFGSPDGRQVHVLRLAFNPADGLLYGVEYSQAVAGGGIVTVPTGQLVRIDPATGAAARIGVEGPNPFNAIAFDRSGNLFASLQTNGTYLVTNGVDILTNQVADHLVRLNPATGEILSDIGDIGLPSVVGLAFLTNGTLLATSIRQDVAADLMLVDTNTAAGTVISRSPVDRTLFGLGVPAAASGMFAPGQVIAPPVSRPGDLKLADMNHDGKLDIVAIGLASQTATFPPQYTSAVMIFTNNGTGTFTLSSAAPFDGQDGSVAVGDLNHDGNLDVVADAFTGGGAKRLVFLGDGAGGIAAAPIISALGPVVGQMLVTNLAGTVDADVAAIGSGQLLVFTGDGTGALPGTLGYPAGGAFYGLALADFNEDGRPDIITAGDTVDLLLGAAGGGFSAPLTNTLTGCCADVVAAGDLNGDGHADWVAPYVDNDASVWLSTWIGNGTGTFINLPDLHLPSLTDAFSIGIKDLNGDGHQDVLLATAEVESLHLLPGNGAGGFGPPITIAVGGPNPYVYEFAIGDVNGDGRPDIVVCNRYSQPGYISVLINKGP